MGGAWPLMPEWVEVAEGPVHRGDRVRVAWDPADPAAEDGHELRLALVVHHRVGPGAAERRVWVVHDRAAVAGAGGSAQLLVPPGVPYSYPGTVLAFLWGVALAGAAQPEDRPVGWSAVQVLP